MSGAIRTSKDGPVIVKKASQEEQAVPAESSDNQDVTKESSEGE
jgi:hypothetical protein